MTSSVSPSSSSSSSSSSILSTSPALPSTAGRGQMEVDQHAAGAAQQTALSASCSLAQSAYPRPSRARQPLLGSLIIIFRRPYSLSRKGAWSLRKTQCRLKAVVHCLGRACSKPPPSSQTTITQAQTVHTTQQSAIVRRCPFFLECAKHNETFSGWTSSSANDEGSKPLRLRFAISSRAPSNPSVTLADAVTMHSRR